MASAESGSITRAGAEKSLPTPPSASSLRFPYPVTGRVKAVANIMQNSFNSWVSKLNGRAALKAARLSDVITGEQVETMINGLVKCERYDSFPAEVRTKILNYRRGRAANIIALLKDSGFIATEHNALTTAAILCDAIPIRGSATHYLPHAHIAPLGLDEAKDVDPAVHPCCRPSGGGWSSSITNADGELKKNWRTEYLAVKQNQYRSYVGFTTDCYDMGDPRRSQNTGGISSFTQYEPSIVRKWLQMRPLAMFVPPEIVVDGISLIKDRTLEEIIDMCQDRTTSRSIDHLPSMEAYGGFGAFAEHMTSELKVATVLDQFFLWDKVERLATPGVTNVAHDCGITAGEGYWIVPSLSSVIDADSPNWNQWQQGSIENKLWAHGLSQFSLWASLAHEEVVSSESEDKIGIWTSLV